MRAHEAELRDANAALVFVGTGLPAMAADFARTHAGPFPVLSDAQRTTYRAAGMRRSAWAFLRPRMLMNLWRALRAGFRQGRVQGDAWQQGGVLVLDRDGRVLHRQVDGASGDALDVAAVLAAVRG